MLNRLFSSFIFGLLLVLPLDFLLFIGLKKYYFDFYKIDVYFNIYFYDNQPFLLLFLISLVLGFFILYTPIRKFIRVLYLIILLCFCSMLFKPFAKQIGHELFYKKDLTCKLGKQEFKADLLYEGRRHYYLKRKNTKKAIKIPKQSLSFL